MIFSRCAHRTSGDYAHCKTTLLLHCVHAIDTLYSFVHALVCVLISICMLSRILWNILKELPFALWQDKTSAEHKRLSGKDYALKKKREVVHAWTDTSQWQQLITFSFWKTVAIQILQGILRLIAVAVLTILFTFVYVYIRDYIW